MILTEVTEGHGSALSIGSFDSSKYKGTPVLDSGPRHDSNGQHRFTDCGIPILDFREEREVIACLWLLARWATKWEVSHNVTMSQILMVMSLDVAETL